MEAQINDAESLSRIREILYGAQMEGLENLIKQVKEELTGAVKLADDGLNQKYNELNRLLGEKTSSNEKRIQLVHEAQLDLKLAIGHDLNEVRLAINESLTKLDIQVKETETRFQKLFDQNLELINQQKLYHETLVSEVKALENAKMDKEKLALLLTGLVKELLINESENHDGDRH